MANICIKSLNFTISFIACFEVIHYNKNRLYEEVKNMSEKEYEIEAPVVTLTLEDDTELECAVLSVFPVEGYEGDYAALLPTKDIDNEDGEIFLYRYKEIDDENLDITNIEDDEEFEAVSEAFDAILDQEEFNSL